MHKKFTKALLKWHRKNPRNLPWKEDRDPYKIWVSEIILQQTRVQQGLPYYNRFVEKFPTIDKLAEAKEETVLKLWQGLGYYSRARNMHHSAKLIVEEMKGVFPMEYEQILSLKGVGPYTAAAIASFAYGLEYPVVDGNVLRVISRIWGVSTSIDQSGTQKEILSICREAISKTDPAEFNQAIMDFGAIQCLPGTPNCKKCPMNKMCVALINDSVKALPIRTKKIRNKLRSFHYVIICEEKKVLVRKRTGEDIWKGLYEFPYLEQEKPPTIKDIFLSLETAASLGVKLVKEQENAKIYKQKLSHQTIKGRFVIYKSKGIEILDKDGYQLVDISLVNNFAVPKIIDLYLSENSITLN